MSLVLAGISARNVYLSRATLTPVHPGDECARILEDCRPGADDVAAIADRPRYRDGLPATAALLGVPEREVPVEVLVASRGTRRAGAGLRCHVWSGPLFDGALCRVDTGRDEEALHVVSPALHFLLRCRELTAVQALLLALQLCGTYELRPDLDAGFATRPRPQARTEELLLAARRLAPGCRGRDRALKAAARAMDGSASPRESGFAAFAVTPRREGGAGLPAPLLNHEVRLTEQARAHLPCQKSVRYDFHWPQSRLACEYDSSWWHDGPERSGADDQRRLAARALGDDLVGVARQTLSSPTATDALFDELARVLQGRRPRPLASSTVALRRELHRLCFGHHVWW